MTSADSAKSQKHPKAEICVSITAAIDHRTPVRSSRSMLAQAASEWVHYQADPPGLEALFPTWTLELQLFSNKEDLPERIKLSAIRNCDRLECLQCYEVPFVCGWELSFLSTSSPTPSCRPTFTFRFFSFFFLPPSIPSPALPALPTASPSS